MAPMPSSKPFRMAPEYYALARWHAMLFPAALVATFVSLVYPLHDTDFWWHLKTGELIWQNHELPLIDWYTFTDFDKPWIDLHWSFQLLITLLHKLGGVNLVILGKATVITAAVALAWQATGRDLPAAIKAALWLLPIVAIAGRGQERPEMLSQLFLAAWLFVAFRAGETPWLVWLLPLVTLVWVNCHALFVLGLVVGACYVADRVAREIARRRFGFEPPSAAPPARTLVWCGALVVVACFCNPYFEEGALFPLTLYRKFTVDQAFYSVNIGEFQQPVAFFRKYGLRNIYFVAELGIWLTTAASFVWVWFKRRRFSLLRFLLFAGWSHLAWEASRNTNIFAIVSAVVSCANVADALGLDHLKFEVRSVLAVSRTTGALLALYIGLIVSGQWNRWGEGNKPFGLGELPLYFIHGPAKFAGQPGFPLRAFVANNGQAAVYEYHNAPGFRTFMDGRLEVCTRETFEKYNAIMQSMARGDPRWVELFLDDPQSPPAVLLDSRGSRPLIIGMLQTPGWRLVFADATGAVFLDDGTAGRLGLPMASPEPLNETPGLKKPR